MADRGWKKAERRMARDVGSERIPVTGERHGADFKCGIACYQLKVRGMLPTWLWTWLAGIQGAGKREGKAGVLVLKMPRQKDSEALVILSWSDWVSLHGVPPGFNAAPVLPAPEREKESQ
jgi:hypothetical protein